MAGLLGHIHIYHTRAVVLGALNLEEAELKEHHQGGEGARRENQEYARCEAYIYVCMYMCVCWCVYVGGEYVYVHICIYVCVCW
jgi:hypothetical protein